MSQQPEDRKPDLSNFPRGAIGIKGLPVGRNARLPSIRSPRDLTLGAQPKRTFMPNIPVRREKRVSDADKNASQLNSGSSQVVNRQNASPKTDRGRGRGRSKAQIIQTEGSVFGEGIAAASPKGRQRESVSRPTSSAGRVTTIKKEKPDYDMKDMTREMNMLLRDDFIDDGDGSSSGEESMKPVIFPVTETKVNKEKTIEKGEKTEDVDNFQNQNFAKELGYDIQKVAKFIKKEKTDETPATKPDISKGPITSATELLTSSDTPFFLLQFSECVTAPPPDYQPKMQSQPAAENSTTNEEKKNNTNLASLPDGRVGVLQILKSGRVRIRIGSLYYYLDCMNSLKSKHEIVSITTDTVPGDLVTIGHSDLKLNFVPDIDSLMS